MLLTHVAKFLPCRSTAVRWDDVVEFTSFHTDLTTQMPAIVAVKNN